MMYLLTSLLACTEPPADVAADDGRGDYLLADANNYSFEGAIEIPRFTTASGTNLTFDWSALTRDLQCHDVDAAEDIDNIALLALPELEADEVEAKVNGDDLRQADLGGYVSVENTDAVTSVELTDLTFFGTDPEILTWYVEDSAAWLLLLTSGTELGVGARTLALLEPLESETSTDVVVNDACGMLDFTVDLESLSPLAIDASNPGSIDWADVSTTGRGAELKSGDVDQLMVAQLDGIDLTTLEDAFLDTTLMASNVWTLDLTEVSTRAELGALTDDKGVAFSGIDTDSIWLFALNCTRCANPAPLLATVLEPL